MGELGGIGCALELTGNQFVQGSPRTERIGSSIALSTLDCGRTGGPKPTIAILARLDKREPRRPGISGRFLLPRFVGKLSNDLDLIW